MALSPWQIKAREARFSRATTIPLPESEGTLPSGSVRTYKINDVRYSENAVLLFCDNMVIKRILAYTDRRYNLEQLRDRHRCLVEGLQWNREFTDQVHLGLVPIREWKLDTSKTISLGETLEDPQLEDLDPGTEYVMIMRKLPKEYRLDYLLAGQESFSQQCQTYALTEYLSILHKYRIEKVSGNWNDGQKWGSIPQLQAKLEHNLDTVDKPVGVKQNILQSALYSELRSISATLRNELIPLFDNDEDCSYFEQRVCDGNIKRCHGDVKARNIWILPPDYAEGAKLQEGVNLLDAIDFNPEYCNIDILSDFAMLAIDVQVRTLSEHLASYMIEDYLHQLGQTDKVARSVLRYYLVEKAFVGAYVSIMYDELPDLGKAYLQSVERELARLKL